MPWMWFIAGPNGSGKTTITRSTRIKELIGNFACLNADDVTEELLVKYRPIPRPAANLAAATIVDGQVDGTIEVSQSFVVETVLSSPKYRRRVRVARKAGFEIGFVFVYTRSPVQNALRVRQRALAGGHDVPSNVVQARWPKSIRNFPWFANRAEYVLLIDNTANRNPREILEKRPGQPWVQIAPAHSAEIEAVIQKALSVQDRFHR